MASKVFENGMEIQTDDNRLASVLNTAKRHLLIGSDQEITTLWDVDSDKPVLPLTALALMAWGFAIQRSNSSLNTRNSPTNLFRIGQQKNASNFAYGRNI